MSRYCVVFQSAHFNQVHLRYQMARENVYQNISKNTEKKKHL